ncbi:MAG: EAL domain-containing protein [Marinobacter sp.]|nr:EAL domain-containing protein [Marinobacter sp.]
MTRIDHTTPGRLIGQALLHPLLPIFIFLLFTVLAAVIQHGVRAQQDEQIRNQLNAEASGFISELENDFRMHADALRRMADRREAMPDMKVSLWQADAVSYIRDFGSFQAVEWIDEHFIIRWLEPRESNEDALGFNVAFNEARRQALTEAARTGQRDMSGILELQQGGNGLVLYEPITVAGNNLGFIAGVFRLDRMVDALIRPRLHHEFEVTLVEPGGQAYVATSEDALAPTFAVTLPAKLAGYDWQVQLIPTQDWANALRSPWPWILFWTLFAIGALFSLLIITAQLFLGRNRELLKTRRELDQEIDQRKAIQLDLARLESTDTLTGLANRRFFMEDLAHTLTIADRQLRQVALVIIDLDRFQTLNDSLGHQVGDELLIQVASRLNTLSDERVLVAYAGGDEFLFCLQQVDDIDEVIHLLGMIKQCFSKPFAILNEPYVMTATMGVAIYPQSGLDADTLLRNADVALYRAKEGGRNNYQFYTEGMQDREVMRLELDKDLSKALAENEFVLFYQPQLDLATREVIGVEGLIRWQHPERGLLPPGDFIPLAEESGRITEIGRWVVQAACKQLAAWKDGPLGHLRIAVNLSGRELDDTDLVDRVEQTLVHHGVPARLLEVELTEEIFIANLEHNLEQLKRLNQLGVHLAIDDFGVGYSSLAYLRDFPVDLLKIDRSFIQRVTERHDDAVITRAVINLAHNLGIQVCAEGLETDAQYHFLKSHRCDLVQGYLLSRPVPADELPQALENIQATLATVAPQH